MKRILFGNDRPELSFTQLPTGSLDIEIENDTVLEFPDGLPDTITWADFAAQAGPQSFRNLATSKRGGGVAAAAELDDELREKRLKEWVGGLSRIVGSPEEEEFLDLYLSACFESVFSEFDSDEPDAGSWLAPALIPQVWVNWIHYDSKSEERAERASKEPFRVDFMAKDSEIQEEPIIIEIDGASHFGSYYTNSEGDLRLESSMEAYTEHLKKDRWLRDKGWSVYRISSLEVQELDGVVEFNSFYKNLLNKSLGVFPF